MTERNDNSQDESPLNDDLVSNGDEGKSSDEKDNLVVSIEESSELEEPESEKDVTDIVSDDVDESKNGAEESISAVTFPQLEVSAVEKQDHPDLLNNVHVDLSVELGRKEMTVEEVSTMKAHDVIELSKLAGEAFEVRINGRIFAVGDVVIIGQNMAVRLTSMVDQGGQIK
ncbi:MAG: FliM/FliN family flagellar motor switch protein [Candidatus Latescibacterota bacterium]|nr:FliM/FliN family flagellar motor switch protein [Candidatus Latescibacterota bacterium]